MGNASAAVIAVSLALGFAAAHADELKTASVMPAKEQNAVLQKYCGSCHNDVLMYGGLSVEHFDAAHPEPSVAAMLVSKLTSGLTPRHVQAAGQGEQGHSKILSLLKNGAMGAAGAGVPDEATQVAFVKALSTQSAGAEQWDARWTDGVANQPQTLSMSIVRELPSTVFAGKTDMYRLILTCRPDSHEGEMKLAWANGVPDEGREMTIEVDGGSHWTHRVTGGKEQGNGKYGPGSTILFPNLEKTHVPFPVESLTIRDVFPNETVVFPFESLDRAVRRNFSACFETERSAANGSAPK